MLLGRLAKPDISPTERVIRKGYHLRLPERDAPTRLNAELLSEQVETSIANALYAILAFVILHV